MRSLVAAVMGAKSQTTGVAAHFHFHALENLAATQLFFSEIKARELTAAKIYDNRIQTLQRPATAAVICTLELVDS